jgi:hypothetical protein
MEAAPDPYVVDIIIGNVSFGWDKAVTDARYMCPNAVNRSGQSDRPRRAGPRVAKTIAGYADVVSWVRRQSFGPGWPKS